MVVETQISNALVNQELLRMDNRAALGTIQLSHDPLTEKQVRDCITCLDKFILEGVSLVEDPITKDQRMVARGRLYPSFYKVIV